MLPLFPQPRIIASPPSNEKSFTLYDGFGKSAFLWSFEPRNLSAEQNSLTQNRATTEVHLRSCFDQDIHFTDFHFICIFFTENFWFNSIAHSAIEI